VVRIAPPLSAVRYVSGTPGSRPTSWKVTEVADLRGDRLLVVHGELDIATAPEIARLLTRMRRLGHAVVLDLAEVTFIDSTGLSALMDAYLESERDGWDFSVRCPSAAVRRVVELAGVGQLLGD
jgi:anti-sigma B factor antagonist